MRHGFVGVWVRMNPDDDGKEHGGRARMVFGFIMNPDGFLGLRIKRDERDSRG